MKSKLGSLFLLLAILEPRLPAEEIPSYHEHQNLGYYIDQYDQPHAIKTIDDWLIRKQHILANMQQVMGPLPKPAEKVPLKVRISEEAKIGNALRRKISYHTDSLQQRVNAYLFIPLNQNKKAPGILCLHQTTRPGKEEPAGLTGNPHLHYALELAQHGYVTLAPDYPSFGEYEYHFGPKHSYLSGTMKAIYDNIRAIDLLTSLPGVDPKNIGCIGHSLGGHNTMFTAVFDERIKALVSCCGFTRFHKYYSGNLQGWTSDRYMPRIHTRYDNSPDKIPFDFPEIVACFAPRAFFTCSPIGDGNFEVSGVKDSLHSAQPIYDLFQQSENLQAVYPNTGHDFPDEARESSYKFLDVHLKANRVD